MMNTSNKDIFDRIMHLPGLRIFESFYLTHKEVLLYLFFGGISFFLNLALFALFTEELKINILFAKNNSEFNKYLLQFSRSAFI